MDVEKKQLRNLYRKLVDKEDSVLYAIDRLNERVLNKVRKSSYEKDKVFYKLFKKLESENENVIKENLEIPFYTPFVEQRKDIDRSPALFSINAPL